MAGPYTVTATLNDPGNNALQGNAFVRFRLRNFQGFVPQVSGTAILAETQIDALPNGSGLISQVLWGNSDITPSTTYYTVEWWNAGRRTSAGNYIFDATTNLNTASPVVTVPTPPGVSPLVLENNGTLNSSQTTLNLESTDSSVVITDEGAGTLNLQASGAGFSGSGAFMIGPGIRSLADVMGASWVPVQSNEVNGSLLTAGKLTVYLFQLDVTLTLTKATVSATSGVFGATSNFGIYSFAGAKLLDTGAFSTVPATTPTNTFTAVTLKPGVYWHAQASSTASPGATFQGLAAVNDAGNILPQFVKNTTRAATATNLLAGGVLPATLGALTAFTPSSVDGDGPCCPVYE
jgi:hypothetical protein